MSVMLRMPFVVLTMCHLDTTGASCQWSGPRAKGVRLVMVPWVQVREDKLKLFVINFDPIRTRDRDLERHFEPYGKVLSVRIRRNFAFVQFETQEDATKALECTKMSKAFDRVISVEYALRDDDERDGRFGCPRRGYGRSPLRRSLSPAYRRGRPSPDYGRPRSPVYDRPRSPYERYDGPGYERHPSPEYGRFRSRSPIRRSRT